jgi:hypothetical protein
MLLMLEIGEGRWRFKVCPAYMRGLHHTWLLALETNAAKCVLVCYKAS